MLWEQVGSITTEGKDDGGGGGGGPDLEGFNISWASLSLGVN
jgi:hypothetical protein